MALVQSLSSRRDKLKQDRRRPLRQQPEPLKRAHLLHTLAVSVLPVGRLQTLALALMLLLPPAQTLRAPGAAPSGDPAAKTLNKPAQPPAQVNSAGGQPPLGTRAESSSSFFAEIEDLDDSSIRTRTGRLDEAARVEEEGTEFEQLIARIVDGPQVFSSSHSQLTEGLSGHGSTVAADANNRTTMRFFRHGKTFGSIVYTNRRGKQPRRLINCHLVDLEKHSSDVALFEAKYEIKTVDIGFNEMMALLESCTNIARFKPLHAAPAQAPSARPFPRPVLVLGPPASRPAGFVQTAGRREEARRVRRQDSGKRPGLLKVLAQVSEAAAGKRLVLGEVTAPPAARAGANKGGIRKALEEISSYDTTDLLAIWRGILPGTNWCGMGDRATSYNDLGFESDIDICCRAHDFCPVRLSAFSGGYGLFNWSFYTRSHCRCDQHFLDCLQRARSPLSTMVLKFYFNIMKTTCLNDNDTNLEPPARRPQVQQVALPTRLRGVEPDAEQQRVLLDQIRAHLAIPASRQSQALQSRLESRPQFPQKRQPQRTSQ